MRPALTRLCAALLPVIFSFLISGCSGPAREISYNVEKSAEKGPIKAVVRLQHKDMTILDTQRLMLEVSAPAGMSLSYPSLSDRLEDFRQVPWRSDDEVLDAGTQRVRKYYAFELYESGEQIVPPLEIGYSSGVGESAISGSLRTPAVPFFIKPLPEGEAWKEELEPMAGLINLGASRWPMMIALSLLAAGVLAGGVLFALRRISRRRAPPPPPPPAHELAYMELAALAEKHRKGGLQGELFVAECSNVLRRYVERRFGARAPEMTTEEFLAGLSSFDALRPHQGVLAGFLGFADLVKFATRPVLAEDIQKGFDFIKGFIEATRERGAAAG